MGMVIHLWRGLLQGGALSPSLYLVLMNDLARNIETFLTTPLGAAIASTWRAIPAETWNLHQLAILWVILLMYADDVTILALEPLHLQALLHHIHSWAERRRVTFSPKSLAVTLSGPSRAPYPPVLPTGEPITLGTMTLGWHPRATHYSYLGTPTRTKDIRAGTLPPIAHAKLEGVIQALERVFTLKNKKEYMVDVPSLMRGLQQVVYASALYPCPVIAVDYKRIDSAARNMTRRVLQLPRDSPSAFLAWELRLLPAELDGELRALRHLHQLWHCHWLGTETLQRYFLRDPDHPIFSVAPLRRLSTILHRYGLSWLSLHVNSGPDPAARARWRAKTKSLVLSRFARLMAARARATPNLSDRQRRQMLAAMRAPITTAQVEEWQADHIGFSWQQPAYLALGGPLAVAGLRFRSPALRATRGHDGHPDCLWCTQASAESGYHLMRCPRAPAELTAVRDAVLTAILANTAPRHHRPREQTTSAANFDRLYHLQWSGASRPLSTTTAPHGPPAALEPPQQPSSDSIVLQGLDYMRLALAMYQTSADARPQHYPTPIRPLWLLSETPSPPLRRPARVQPRPTDDLPATPPGPLLAPSRSNYARRPLSTRAQPRPTDDAPSTPPGPNEAPSGATYARRTLSQGRRRSTSQTTCPARPPARRQHPHQPRSRSSLSTLPPPPSDSSSSHNEPPPARRGRRSLARQAPSDSPLASTPTPSALAPPPLPQAAPDPYLPPERKPPDQQPP
jgi:hypothetical protein